MFDDPPRNQLTDGDHWDRVFEQLASSYRRLVIVSLMKAPEERRLSLPESLYTHGLSVDREQLAIQLQHHHLPRLADGGYVHWSTDPFCVQRGPNFDHAAAVLRIIRSEADRLPDALIEDCPALEAATEGN